MRVDSAAPSAIPVRFVSSGDGDAVEQASPSRASTTAEQIGLSNEMATTARSGSPNESTTIEAYSTSSESRMAYQQTSPLLSLQPELRNMIYQAVFENCILELDLRRDKHSPDLKRNKFSPESVGLLLAFKQTYNEAINVYYSLVTVKVLCFCTFQTWVRELPVNFLRQIPKIQYDINYFDGRGLGHDGGQNNAVLRDGLRSLREIGVIVQSEQLSIADIRMDSSVVYVKDIIFQLRNRSNS
jgi:hypothetical protein